jgi:uncharacterized protein
MPRAPRAKLGDAPALLVWRPPPTRLGVSRTESAPLHPTTVLTSILARALLALLCVGLMLLLIWRMQGRLMYLPFGVPGSPATAGLPDADATTLTTTDGLLLGAWFIPPHSPTRRETVIVFNGNAGHRGYRAPLARALAQRGIGVLLFDYRGFGGNAGSPSETGLVEDARAAHRYLARRTDVDDTRVVYFGESLGTGVAIQLAREHPPHALILRSPFTSMTDVARHHYWFLPVRWLLRDRYPSDDHIRHVTSPVLVVAGERDTIVPPLFSQRLYEAAVSPRRLVMIQGADHNDHVLLAGEPLLDAMETFLDQVADHPPTR